MTGDRKRLLGHVETIQFILGVTDNCIYQPKYMLSVLKRAVSMRWLF